LDHPKSANLTIPSTSSKIFSGLMSLWIIGGSKECKYWTAEMHSLRYYAAIFSLNLPSFLSNEYIYPLAQY